MKTAIVALFTAILTMAGCSGSSRAKTSCFDSIIQTHAQDPGYTQIREHLLDTLHSWADMKVERAQRFKQNECIIDAIIFNSTRNKCFFSILVIEKDRSVAYDDVQYGVGMLDNDSAWRFYVAGIPTLAVSTAETKGKPSIISSLSRKELIRGGILSEKDCKVNDVYIEDWFKKDLNRLHKRFLNNRIE